MPRRTNGKKVRTPHHHQKLPLFCSTCPHNPTIPDSQFECGPRATTHPTIPVNPTVHTAQRASFLPLIKTSALPSLVSLPSFLHTSSHHLLLSPLLRPLPLLHSFIHPSNTIILTISSSFLTNILHRGSFKMVQSAILGFPRMGVNRDLKKATEACRCSPSSYHSAHRCFRTKN